MTDITNPDIDPSPSQDNVKNIPLDVQVQGDQNEQLDGILKNAPKSKMQMQHLVTSTERDIIGKQITDSRFLKELAQEEEIPLYGNKGKVLEDILQKADFVLTRVMDENHDWIEEKRNRFDDYLADVSEDQFLDSFQNGLDNFLKQQYRLFKKIEPQRVKDLQNEEYLSKQISLFTFDYLRSLGVYKRKGIAAKTALELAKASYRYDPSTHALLEKKYTDLPGSIITHVMLSYSDADGQLQHIQQSVAVLGEKYPEFPRSDILEILLRYEDASAFLEETTKNIAHLHEMFPDFSTALIRYAIIKRPAKPELFLKTIDEQAKVLDDEFSDLGKGPVRHALLNYKDPKAFLEGVQNKLPELQAMFGDIPFGIIRHAALNQNDPEKYLRDFRISLDDLKKKYPEFSKTTIARAIVHRVDDPESLLQSIKQNLDAVSLEFPEIRKENITNILLHSPTNFRSKLENISQQLPNLIKKFPDLDSSYIERILVRSKEADLKLVEASIRMTSYKQLFPNIDTEIFFRLLRYSKDRAMHILSSINNDLPGMKEQYPEVGERVLQHMLAQPPEKRDAYLSVIKHRVEESMKLYPNYKQHQHEYYALHYPAVVDIADDIEDEELD